MPRAYYYFTYFIYIIYFIYFICFIYLFFQESVCRKRNNLKVE